MKYCNGCKYLKWHPNYICEKHHYWVLINLNMKTKFIRPKECKDYTLRKNEKI